MFIKHDSKLRRSMDNEMQTVFVFSCTVFKNNSETIYTPNTQLQQCYDRIISILNALKPIIIYVRCKNMHLHFISEEC